MRIARTTALVGAAALLMTALGAAPASASADQRAGPRASGEVHASRRQLRAADSADARQELSQFSMFWL